VIRLARIALIGAGATVVEIIGVSGEVAHLGMFHAVLMETAVPGGGRPPGREIGGTRL